MSIPPAARGPLFFHPTHHVPWSQMEPTPIRSRKILIVDDNRIDRETCRRFLTRNAPPGAYTFVEHNSVEGALDVMRREKPDCILLDYQLHDGNGIDFLRELASDGGPRTWPVVMLTGTGSETIAVEVMKIGAQDYLVKDRLNPEILQRAVEGAIYKAHTERLLETQRREMERLFKETQEANARKDQFLAALSHELRTPLTPVLAAVSALDDSDCANPEETRAMLAVIRRNIELEARLIDDMLDLTRISSGKLEVDPRPADLHCILNHAAETCREDMQRRGLRLIWNLNAGQSTVHGDAARLQQVFWNLLKNAVKFTPDGGEIRVSTQNTENGEIEVRVADNGIGILPSRLDKIFNAFEQGDPAITRQFGGLGLGLAISRALIEAHGGTIRAESDPRQKGAEFIVTLRAHAAPADLPAPGNDTQAWTAPARENGGRPVILLVEDHADSAFFLERLLRRRGFKVHTAASVREALEIFQNEPVNCVVSDIGLPDGSGTDLMRRLRAIRPVPGIALSGYGMEQDLERSRDAGFSRHLIKPVTAQKLDEALRDMLEEQSPNDENQGSSGM